MANELGRNAVEEMYIPQLVMRKNNVSLATEGPNLASTALWGDGWLSNASQYKKEEFTCRSRAHTSSRREQAPPSRERRQ